MSKRSDEVKKPVSRYRQTDGTPAVKRTEVPAVDSLSKVATQLKTYYTPPAPLISPPSDPPAGVISAADSNEKVGEIIGAETQSSSTKVAGPTTSVGPFKRWNIFRKEGVEYVSISNIASFYRFSNLTMSSESFHLRSSKLHIRSNGSTLLIANTSLNLINTIMRDDNMLYISTDDLNYIIDPLLRPNKIQPPAQFDKIFIVTLSRTEEIRAYIAEVIDALSSTLEDAGREITLVSNMWQNGSDDANIKEKEHQGFWQEKISNIKHEGLTLIIEEPQTLSQALGQRAVCMSQNKIDVAVAAAIQSMTLVNTNAFDGGISIKSINTKPSCSVVCIQIDKKTIMQAKTESPLALSTLALRYGTALGEGIKTASKAISSERSSTQQ